MMKYFKDLSDHVYAYEDDADEKYIKDGLTSITAEEAETLRLANLPPAPDYTTATKLSVVRYLKSTGEWPSLKAVIEADPDVYEEWLLSNELLITDPTVQAMKAVQGWTDQELQDLFNAVNA